MSLGYGVANLQELKLSPSEKLTIPLQSRRNGFHGGNLEVEVCYGLDTPVLFNRETFIYSPFQLLLMEHNVDDEQVNLPEKSEYQKVPVELAAYQRDHLSSTSTCFFLLSLSFLPPPFSVCLPSTLFLLTLILNASLSLFANGITYTQCVCLALSCTSE